MPNRVQPRRENRGRIFALRLTDAERAGLGRIAGERKVEPSTLVRGLILGLIAGGASPDGAGNPASTAPGPGSWRQVFDSFVLLSPLERSVEFSALARARKVPDGFASWTVGRRIKWLDAHWPLEVDRG